MTRHHLPAAVLLLAFAACSQAMAPPAPESDSAMAPPTPGSPSAVTPPAPRSPSAVAPATNKFGEPELKIDPADQTCSSDADCSMTLTQCECDCGSPVNVKRVQAYRDARERMCQHYEGRMCKMAPCTDTAICDRGVCRIRQ